MTHQAASLRPSPRSDRHRFVAFAFAAADAFLEVDADLNILYAGGAVAWLTGTKTPGALNNGRLSDWLGKLDLSLVRAGLRTAAAQGRMPAIKVAFGREGGKRHPVMLSGTCLPDHPQSIFLAFKAVALLPTGGLYDGLRFNDQTGLLERDDFIALAEALVGNGASNSESLSMSLVELDGLTRALKGRPEEEAASILTELTAVVRSFSIEGQSGGDLGDDRFSLIGSGDMDRGALHAAINARLQTLLPEAQVKAQSVQIPVIPLPDGLGDARDVARAIAYTVGKFADGIPVNDLSSLEKSYEQMMRETEDRMTQFRQVVRHDRFDMVLQPIVHLATDRVHHFEALARFPSKDGDDSPYRFISFAEDIGLIFEFDLAMCRRVIKRVKQTLAQKQKISIAVNLSGQSLQNDAFMAALEELLDGEPDVWGSLMFEVTESSKIEDLGGANAMIKRLRKRKLPVCLDDFGAGAAGFQYLRELEVDYVKIDGVYVTEALETRNGPIFLKSMADLCRGLGIKTIGERVESQEHADLLKSIQVDYGQGYHFMRPTTGG